MMQVILMMYLECYPNGESKQSLRKEASEEYKRMLSRVKDTHMDLLFKRKK